MVDLGAWREHLALEKRTVPEIVTAVSVTALTGATFYNLGFFAPIEWSLISLLTVQDLIIAATISLLPMSLAAVLTLISRLVRWAPANPKRVAMFGLPLIVVTGLGLVVFLEGPLPSMPGFLVCAYFFLGGLVAAANVLIRHALLPVLWLGFSLIYIPLATGTAESLASMSDRTSAVSEVQTDQGVLPGTVLRITSGYLLLFDGASVTTTPLSKVRSVKRLYRVSPEADFLPLLRSRARALPPAE
jgi:hypothetical protein